MERRSRRLRALGLDRALRLAYMTLVLNEIHMLDGLNDTVLIAAADRRISAQGKYYGTARKAFRIPYLNGALLYFGLAVFKDHSGKLMHLSEWLPAFIRHHSSTRDLNSFCFALQKRLELFIPPSVLGAEPSGFQICGYNSDFIPEYWLLTNIRNIDTRGKPTEIKATYKAPAPHFLKVDAKRDFHWDGVSPDSCREWCEDLSLRRFSSARRRLGADRRHVQAVGSVP